MGKVNSFVSRKYFLENSLWKESLLEKSNFRAKISFSNTAIVDKMVAYVETLKLTTSQKDHFSRIIGSAGSGDERDMLANNITAISIPQFSLDIKRVMTLGEVRYSIRSNEYQDIRLIFMEDANLSIKSFFEVYMRCFFDQDSLLRNFYPDDIAFELEVSNLDEFGEPKSKEVYSKCIPSFINDFNYDVSDGADTISTTEIIAVFKKQKIGGNE